MFKLVKHFNRIRGWRRTKRRARHKQSKVEQLLFQIFNFSVEMAHISTLWRIGLITFVNSLGLNGQIDAITVSYTHLTLPTNREV